MCITHSRMESEFISLVAASKEVEMVEKFIVRYKVMAMIDASNLFAL